MTKYDPRKNAEGYNDPTPYAAEKHMMAQIRGKQARVAGGYAEIRDRIVELMGDLPRIELFAREAAPGWDVWGNEAPTPEVKDAPADSVELAGKEETHEPDDQRDPAPQL